MKTWYNKLITLYAKIQDRLIVENIHFCLSLYAYLLHIHYFYACGNSYALIKYKRKLISFLDIQIILPFILIQPSNYLNRDLNSAYDYRQESICLNSEPKSLKYLIMVVCCCYHTWITQCCHIRPWFSVYSSQVFSENIHNVIPYWKYVKTNFLLYLVPTLELKLFPDP